MITIVDYGMGNLGSIRNMLKKIGVDCCVTADLEIIKAADKLILSKVRNINLILFIKFL